MSSEPELDVKLTENTVGAVVSMVTVRLEDVDVTVESDKIVVDSAVMTLSPAVRTAVSHDHAPVVLLVVQVFPDDTPSTNNCTVDPTGAEPVNVSVVADVMLSVVVPVSSAASRSGVDVVGTAYRTTTIPEPPAPATDAEVEPLPPPPPKLFVPATPSTPDGPFSPPPAPPPPVPPAPPAVLLIQPPPPPPPA